MYVDDVDDLAELEELLADAQDRLASNPSNEQAAWDVEDIEGRMEELSAEVNDVA
ncbi:hypothetical protein SEA_BOBSWAGET_69 [Mycobacterium phage BobSwaget]|nr:hypothetical protein SEA_BOBSWAGET_69 [Mycobacterium phage BobSwaget]QGH78764.1 hypothetical protein SEA_MIKO_70 [Mycobacterium phage Miko]